MQKYFTISEAAQMIPTLERAFGRIHQIKMLFQVTFSYLEGLGFAPQDENFRMHPVGADLEVIDALADLKMLTMEFRKQIERLTQDGCVVKDVDLGWVDFPAQQEGCDIMLCWKLGDKSVEYWHAVGESDQSRQSISILNCDDAAYRNAQLLLGSDKVVG